MDSNSNDYGQGSVKDQKYLKKFMVFELDNKLFAAPLDQIKEVVALQDTTPVPEVPRYFKGIINLRGKIISILDLRTKLGIKETEVVLKKTSIIITEINNNQMGLIVDNVVEVAGINEEQIDRSSYKNKDYITGVAKRENREITVILDFAIALKDDLVHAAA